MGVNVALCGPKKTLYVGPTSCYIYRDYGCSFATPSRFGCLLNGSRSFRLTSAARAALDSRIKYKKRSARDQHSGLVRAYLDVNEDIGRSEAASLLRVGETRASAILSDLYNKYGLIKPVGAARGRGVRYTLSK